VVPAALIDGVSLPPHIFCPPLLTAGPVFFLFRAVMPFDGFPKNMRPEGLFSHAEVRIFYIPVSPGWPVIFPFPLFDGFEDFRAKGGPMCHVLKTPDLDTPPL